MILRRPSLAILAFALLLILGSAAALVFLRTADGELAPELPEAIPALPAAAADATADGVQANKTAQAADSNRSDRAVAEASASHVRPFPDDAKWIELTVVLATTQQPVADAEVRWFCDRDWEEFSRNLKGWQDRERLGNGCPPEVVRAVGWTARSDAEGKVRVTQLQWTRVAAQKDQLYGETLLRTNTAPPTGGFRIELEPDATLTLRVLDHHNQPCAGVPVSAVFFPEPGKPHTDPSWAPLAFSSGEDGIARIEHVRQLCANQSRTSDLAKAEIVPFLALPGTPMTGTHYPIDALPREPVVLRIPACGLLEVRAKVQGTPAADFTMAWMSPQRDGDEGDADVYLMGIEAMAVDGQVATFQHVLLGQKWNVYAMAAGGLNAEVVGPVAEGQTVSCELNLDANAVLLTGRLLWPDGTPCVEQKFDFRGEGPELWSSREAKTDRSGNFSLQADQIDEPKQADKLLFTVTRPDQPPCRAAVSPRVLRPGQEPLGDVLLGDAPLLVGGRLLAASDMLPKGIHLHIQHEVLNEEQQTGWEELDDQYAHVEPNGAFAVRGTAETGRCRLCLQHASLVSQPPVEFTLGATNLEIHLAASHAVAANLLVGPNTVVSSLKCTLVPTSPQPTTEKGRSKPLQAEAEASTKGTAAVRWPAVPPGEYTLEVQTWSRVEPLLRIPAIAVPLPNGGDPRLGEIDLRALLRTIRIELRMADGTALDNYAMTLLQQSSNANWLSWRWWGEPRYVTLPVGPYDLMCCVEERRPALLRGNADTAEVRLDSWPELPVEFPNHPEWPKQIQIYGALRLQQPQEHAVKTAWGSQSAAEYFGPASHRDLMVPSPTLPVGDGPHVLQIHVYGNDRGEPLTILGPKQVLPTDRRIVVQVAPEEWQRVFAIVAPDTASTKK